MTNSSFFPTALAIAGFVALAGCSSGDNRSMAQSRSVEPVATAAVAPVPANTPEVSPGMVRRIQTALKQQGLYKGHIDGQWGPQTKSALHGYQEAHNLTDNGQIDPQTLASLQVASGNTSSPTPTAMPHTAPPATATTN
jgi:peptidoglycan hydrolase-like protein with peptidoglycan-binding domain